MAESLYVCLFSNGHVKVGRSVDPMSRIAAHADRVACMGVGLEGSYSTPCAEPSAPRETMLIQRCTKAATDRFKSEWFAGLSYDEVCAWAAECAGAQYEIADTGIRRAVLEIGGPAKCASALGHGVTRQNVEHWLRVGRVPAEHCCDLERLTGVDRSLLRPDDFARIWPHLSAAASRAHSPQPEPAIPSPTPALSAMGVHHKNENESWVAR